MRTLLQGGEGRDAAPQPASRLGKGGLVPPGPPQPASRFEKGGLVPPGPTTPQSTPTTSQSESAAPRVYMQ
eukprot:5772432-Amphidinium_carterae.1